MIVIASKKILQYLLSMEVVEDTSESRAYYQYGIEITLSSILNVVLILLLGIIFASILESTIFLISFIVIRQFTGGFHASSYFRCNLIFCTCFLAVLLICKIIEYKMSLFIMMGIILFSILSALRYCPVEHENKPLSQWQQRTYKILSVILCLTYGLSAIMLSLNFIKYGTLMIMTLLLITCLVIIEKIRKGEWRT